MNPARVPTWLWSFAIGLGVAVVGIRMVRTVYKREGQTLPVCKAYWVDELLKLCAEAERQGHRHATRENWLRSALWYDMRDSWQQAYRVFGDQPPHRQGPRPGERLQ
jgi:hypothetical protein